MIANYLLFETLNTNDVLRKIKLVDLLKVKSISKVFESLNYEVEFPGC